MNPGRIRGFLIALPKPTRILVRTSEGEDQEIKPGRSWAKVAETIAALDPIKLELYDADDKLLRAQRYDDADSRRSDAAEVPDSLRGDPHAAMLTHFANLLHRAYEHSTEVAFVRLVEITDRMNERSDAIERRLERTEAQNRRLFEQQLEDAIERAHETADVKEGGGFADQMLSSFLGGRGMAAQPMPPPKPNGTAKTNGRV
jgi:hypothetical protein